MDLPLMEIDIMLDNFNRSRRIGKTTSAVELVKKCNGILVCLNVRHAKKIADKYSIETVSLDQLRRLFGINKPVVYDPDTLFYVIFSLSKYKRLYKRLKEINDEFERELHP